MKPGLRICLAALLCSASVSTLSFAAGSTAQTAEFQVTGTLDRSQSRCNHRVDGLGRLSLRHGGQSHPCRIATGRAAGGVDPGADARHACGDAAGRLLRCRWDLAMLLNISTRRYADVLVFRAHDNCVTGGAAAPGSTSSGPA